MRILKNALAIVLLTFSLNLSGQDTIVKTQSGESVSIRIFSKSFKNAPALQFSAQLSVYSLNVGQGSTNIRFGAEYFKSDNYKLFAFSELYLNSLFSEKGLGSPFEFGGMYYLTKKSKIKTKGIPVKASLGSSTVYTSKGYTTKYGTMYDVAMLPYERMSYFGIRSGYLASHLDSVNVHSLYLGAAFQSGINIDIGKKSRSSDKYRHYRTYSCLSAYIDFVYSFAGDYYMLHQELDPFNRLINRTAWRFGFEINNGFRIMKSFRIGTIIGLHKEEMPSIIFCTSCGVLCNKYASCTSMTGYNCRASACL